MKKIESTIHKSLNLIIPYIKRSKKGIIFLIAMIASLVYLGQLIIFAQTQESVVDEGAYLYKGYLFASGTYTPYQDYGPWTNHMPLSFLIPGYIQLIFEPGIHTGRYFAIVLGMFTLLGIWIVIRRFAGDSWATVAVWLMALNPALIKTYSVFVSQGLVVAMLTWAMVFILGKERKIAEIFLGAVLVGLIPVTRVNMLPILPLAIIYIFWQRGAKIGAFFTLVSLTAFLGIHIAYWPGILKFWASKLPRSVTPFLDAWRVPTGYKKSWSPDIPALGRILSIFITVRFHFTSLIGSIVCWLLWPKRKAWKEEIYRICLFLTILFITLFIVHAMASLGKDYCVFCLSGYYAFFAPLGIMIMTISFPYWENTLSPLRKVSLIVFLLLITTGIGFGAFEELGETLQLIQIPRFLFGETTKDTVHLGAILQNKFHFEPSLMRRLLPTMSGAFIGVLLIILSYYIMHVIRRRPYLETRWNSLHITSTASLAISLALALGSLLSPTVVLGGGSRAYDCPGGNVIKTYESAGKHLAATIPENSLVFWKGTLSTVPLLYAPDIQIFPAQINDGYSFFTKGDSDVLLRLGYWNEELAHQWAIEADFVLIEQGQFKGWIRTLVLSGEYLELDPTPPTVACRQNSFIRVFQKIHHPQNTP